MATSATPRAARRVVTSRPVTWLNHRLALLVGGLAWMDRTIARLEGWFLIFCGGLLALDVVNEFVVHRWQLRAWDAMFISGFTAYIVGVWLARGVPDRLRRTLDRLIDRKVLQLAGSAAGFHRYVEDRADLWAPRGGIAISVALLTAFSVAFVSAPPEDYVLLAVFEAAIGYVAGRHLGRMASHGRLYWLITVRKECRLQTDHLHVDGAAGLKPVGDFFFYQATLVAIPAMFLAVWWFAIAIGLWPDARYDQWQDPYLGLLLIAMALEILAFLLPLWSFHQEMVSQKADRLKEADSVSQEITKIQAELARLRSDERRSMLQSRLASKTKQYWDYENMPTWPVDTRTRRLFTLNQVGLFLPIATQLVSWAIRGQSGSAGPSAGSQQAPGLADILLKLAKQLGGALSSPVTP